MFQGVYPPASMEHAQSLPVVRQKLLIDMRFTIEHEKAFRP